MNRLRLVVLFALVLFAGIPAAIVVAEPSHSAPVAKPSAKVLEIGRKGYRQFCGQCHALEDARAVGFGSAKNKGVGEDGGPGFNQLKISYAMSMASVTMLFGGHEKVIRKMTWQQIKDVSKYLQWATRDHPIVAKFSDG